MIIMKSAINGDFLHYDQAAGLGLRPAPNTLKLGPNTHCLALIWERPKETSEMITALALGGEIEMLALQRALWTQLQAQTAPIDDTAPSARYVFIDIEAMTKAQVEWPLPPGTQRSDDDIPF